MLVGRNRSCNSPAKVVHVCCFPGGVCPKAWPTARPTFTRTSHAPLLQYRFFSPPNRPRSGVRLPLITFAFGIGMEPAKQSQDGEGLRSANGMYLVYCDLELTISMPLAPPRSNEQ